MNTPPVNWDAAATADTPDPTPQHAAHAPVPRTNLPELPEIIGRLPIKPGTGVAVLQLPQPVKGVSCAAVFANSSILSDCDRPAPSLCNRPAVKYARPLNDREIEVVFWDGDEKITGPGWKDNPYPGGQLETRVVPIGVPFVEVKLVVGRTIQCGCDPERWAGDDYPVGG
ncbi:hypothetical protein [Saccharothrix sp. HUAS TT1]|uniref:hypothetical protein n=1 Tax=unclassified Saccharothrix TaxID=2593673 RepID=UPI00345BAEC4